MKNTFKEKLIEWFIINPIMFVLGCIVWIMYKFGVFKEENYQDHNSNNDYYG